MDCDRALELLALRLDGRLSGEENRELEKHLAACPDCRAAGAQPAALQGAFPELEDIEAPEGFAQGVMDRIRAEEKPKVIPLFKRPQVRALAGLAACLVLAVGLYGASVRQNEEKMMLATRSFHHDVVTEADGVAAQEALPGASPRVNAALAGPEDAPQIAAYAAPPVDTSAGTAGMEKTAPGAMEDGSGDWPLMEGITCLERMPEGAAELIPPETAVTPTDDRRGSIYLDLPLEVLDQIERLAEEQGIGITAERCSAPEAEVQYNLVILQQDH